VRLAARKHQGFRRHNEHEAPLPHPEKLFSHEPAPDEAVSMKEDESRFRELVAQLPESDRRAVELWQAGKKPAEITAELGLTPWHVYELLRRLRERLSE
jgi:RNA polymerase sigma factor (sigma-70 family)